MSYPDESNKVGVWRVLPAAEFEKWLDAQKNVPATIRYLVDHHTWSPSTTPQDPQKFLASVKSIFRNYYELPKYSGGRGWKRDNGPQLWLGVIDGKPWVVIAANLSVHGPQCAYFNACSVGIETMWNGDKKPWSEPFVRGLYFIHRAFEKRLGIPLVWVGDKNVPTKDGTGYLFHRDAKDAGKTCPGSKNSRLALQRAFNEYKSKEEDMPISTADPNNVKPQLEKLVKAGIVTEPEARNLDDAASVGLLWVIAGRLAEKAGLLPKA